MANENSAEKAKREADEAARKEALAKAEAESKEKADADAKERAEAAEKARVEAAKNAERKLANRPDTAGKPAASAETPHPTQAELDAMRNGTYRHGREAKADGKSLDYKTR
jgi:colicin import membrane protein